MHNHYGMWMLYKKEVVRFLKVYNQTLIAPMMNALLLLAVFHLAVGRQVTLNGLSIEKFMVPGLIMMTIVQQAFANTSSSLVMGKVLGSVIDLLIPPISGAEITFALTLAGITRGIMAGIMVAISVIWFVPLTIHNLGFMLIYVFLASCMLSLIGLLTGILAESFDQMSAMTSYVITPLSFLAGTFYSVSQLPPFWQSVSYANPFFYMIDGFRYSMTGVHDGNIMLGLLFLIVTNIVLYFTVQQLFHKGYRLKG
jgi:ABC-2 type transport system permease protein